jgi:hypothetical protein
VPLNNELWLRSSKPVVKAAKVTAVVAFVLELP